jgi:hypothetical protein
LRRLNKSRAILRACGCEWHGQQDLVTEHRLEVDLVTGEYVVVVLIGSRLRLEQLRHLDRELLLPFVEASMADVADDAIDRTASEYAPRDVGQLEVCVERRLGNDSRQLDGPLDGYVEREPATGRSPSEQVGDGMNEG